METIGKHRFRSSSGSLSLLLFLLLLTAPSPLHNAKKSEKDGIL